MKRKHYIDNLRWIAILLLFPFHAAQVWCGDVKGYYVWSHTDTFMNIFSTAVFPWYMTLLFAIAGMSCKYAMHKRSEKQFIGERVRKLLIPMIFGTLVLAPVMTYVGEVYFNGYEGSYIAQYKLFFTKETDLTGYQGGFTPGHYWFLLYLFIISLIGLLAIRFQKKCIREYDIKKVRYPLIVMLFIPEWISIYILNIGGKSLGQYTMLYLIGYFILSEEHILREILKYRYLSLILAAVSGFAYTWLYCFGGVRNELITGIYIFYGWCGILALLGFGQKLLNFENSSTRYLSRASFPVYILHMPVLVVTAYFAVKTSAGVAGQFLMIVSVSAALTFILYEAVKRIPVLRFLLGISKPKKQ